MKKKILNFLFSYYMKILKRDRALAVAKDALKLLQEGEQEYGTNLSSTYYSIQLQHKMEELARIKEMQNALIEEQRQRYNSYLFLGIIMSAVTGFYAWSFHKKWKETRRQKEKIEEQERELSKKNATLMENISSASTIQNAMMKLEGLHLYFRETFILYLPRDVVSGDFYWSIHHNGALYLVYGDATGHGVSGALLTVMLISMFREALTEKKLESPADILNYVRGQVMNVLPGQERLEGMEGILMKVVKKDGYIHITYASSRFTPVLVDGATHECSILQASPIPISRGWFENATFTNFSINLKEGDTLYVFSDGYKDQIGGPKQRPMGKKRFIALLHSIASSPLTTQKHILEEKLREWQNGCPQIDDILVAGFRC